MKFVLGGDNLILKLKAPITWAVMDCSVGIESRELRALTSALED